MSVALRPFAWAACFGIFFGLGVIETDEAGIFFGLGVIGTDDAVGLPSV